MPANDQSGINTSPDAGAQLVLKPMTRTIETYALTESEIDSISILNAQVSFILPFGTAILGFGISKFSDLVACKVPDDQVRWAYSVPIAACLIGLALVALSLIVRKQKKTEKEKILKNARVCHQAANPGPTWQ